MRRDHVDTVGNGEAAIIGEYHESRDAAGARRLAGPRKQRVDVGDAPVGDPGLLAVDDIIVAVGARRAGHRRDVRAGLLLRQGKGREPFARTHFWQDGFAQLCGAAERDRTGAEPLHGEGEIGKAVGIGERLARQADRARVDRRRIAVGRRNGAIEQARRTHRAHQLAAGAVDIIMVNLVEHSGLDKAIERLADGPVTRLEERPVQPLPPDDFCNGTHLSPPLFTAQPLRRCAPDWFRTVPCGQILLRPLDRSDADARGLVQRPGGIGRMRPRDGAEIGARPAARIARRAACRSTYFRHKIFSRR